MVSAFKGFHCGKILPSSRSSYKKSSHSGHKIDDWNGWEKDGTIKKNPHNNTTDQSILFMQSCFFFMRCVLLNFFFNETFLHYCLKVISIAINPVCTIEASMCAHIIESGQKKKQLDRFWTQKNKRVEINDRFFVRTKTKTNAKVS